MSSILFSRVPKLKSPELCDMAMDLQINHVGIFLANKLNNCLLSKQAHES